MKPAGSNLLHTLSPAHAWVSCLQQDLRPSRRVQDGISLAGTCGTISIVPRCPFISEMSVNKCTLFTGTRVVPTTRIPESRRKTCRLTESEICSWERSSLLFRNGLRFLGLAEAAFELAQGIYWDTNGST